MKKEKSKSRFESIDILRGIAVVLMIFFHFSFDLNYFQLIQIDIIKAPFWYFLPRLIVFLFLFTSGVSLSLVHTPKILWHPFLKRFMKLAFFAGLVSLATYLFFREHWIYFGTLHVIAVTSFLSLPFLRFPRLAFVVCLLLFTPSILWDKTLPWFELPHQSFDYISPFPWIGAPLLGFFAKEKNAHVLHLPPNKLFNVLKFLGQHSLIIYLTHQVILFGLTFLIYRFIHF